MTALAWAPASPSWSDDPRWITERMTIDGEQWVARIRPGSNPKLPPVVMIHGVIISGTYFRPIANLLDQSYEVYIPDLPGVGRPYSTTQWTLPLLTEHLAGWMDAHGISQAIMVGNSFGCQVTTLLATIRPDLVRAQVLIAPTLDPRITNIPAAIWKSALVFPRENPSIWATWIPDFFKTGPLRSLHIVRQMFGDDLLTRLEGVAQPTVVIGGEWDTISPPAWIYRMASRIPRGEALVIPRASHALNYSRPQSLVDSIERMVSRLLADHPCP